MAQKAKPTTKIAYSEEVVTPEIAKRYLGQMVNNRPVLNSRVEFLADVMKKGNFRANGECIKFNEDGFLCDGQHRLEAIVRSGCAVKMSILRGCPTEDFVTYDTPLNRRPSDLISFESRYYKHIGPLATSYLKFNRNCKTIDSNNMTKHRLNISNEDVYNEYMRRPQYWERAAQNFKRWRNRNTHLIPSFTILYAGTIYLEERGFSRELMDEFFERLTDFNDTRCVTVNTIRQYLVKEMGNRIGRCATDNKNVVFAKILHGMKNYINGNHNVARIHTLVNKTNIGIDAIFNLR